MDGPEFEGGATNPIGKVGSVGMYVLTAVDLGQPVEQPVIGMLAHQHMSDSAIVGHAIRDQPPLAGAHCCST